MTDPRPPLVAGLAFVAVAFAVFERRRGASWRAVLGGTAGAAAAGLAAAGAVALVADRIPATGNPLGPWKYVWGAAYVVFLLARAASSVAPLLQGEPTPIAVGALAFLFLLGGAPWLGQHTVGGDDVWYVLMAFSIADDLDIRIDDEIRAAAYRRWLHVAADDGAFLSGMSVGAEPPVKTKAFYGASAVLAPIARLVIAVPAMPVGVARALLGIPGVLAGAATFGLAFAAMRGVGAEPRRAATVLSLVLLATPLPFWFHSLSPEAFLPLATTAGVWASIAPAGRAGRLAGLAAWAALPWLHPRVIPAALIGAAILPPAGVRPVAVCLAATSLAAKVAADAALGAGLFAGYAGDAGYAVTSPAAYAANLLGPWIGADTAFLLYAPATVLGLAGLFGACRGAPAARRLAAWCACQFLLLGLSGAWHGVNGVGRLFVDVLYPMMILAALVEPRRGLTPLASSGVAWNLLFMTFPLLWFYLPSGSLARHFGLDVAWVLPEFGGEAAHFRHHWPSPWIPAVWALPLAAWWVRRFAPR